MNRRKDLPDGLRDGPFTVGAAIEGGVSPSRLRGSDLSSPWWGVRTVGISEDLAASCRALVQRLGDRAIISSTTAARLWGAPLPSRTPERPVHVTYLAGSRAPDADGVVGHQWQLDDADVTVLSGVPITGPARTWTDVASELALPDLVAVGDFLIHFRSPLATVDDLADAIRRRPSRRGAAILGRALRLVNDRSESRPETIIRVAVVEAGLPELVVNGDLFDANGCFVARPDLRFRDWPLVIEYEGDHHRTDARQWRKDMTRVGEIENLGLTVIRLGAHDLARLDHVVSRVRSRLFRLGWTP